MKLGILGTGMIVQDLMNTYDKLEIEETYLLSTVRSIKKAQALVEKYHLHGVFDDYDEMLKSDIDTIYCALPNHLHYSFCKKALLAKKHVIIEKPVTANVKELEALIEIAKENDLMIFEAMNIHYLPSYQALKQDISKLGQIKIVNFNYSQYSSRYDAFKNGEILPVFDYHKAGGALMDLNVYNIHALIGLFGMPQQSLYMANVEKQIDTSGILTCDYPTFKAVTIGAKDCKSPLMNSIQGDLASLIVYTPLSQMTEYTIYYNNGKSETRTFDLEHRLYYEFTAFIRMIKEKDYHQQQKMLQLSLQIAQLMEKSRKQERIVFDNDK